MHHFPAGTMNHSPRQIKQHFTHEAYGLLERLRQTDPFSITMPMVAAAGISQAALQAITQHWGNRRSQLEKEIGQFLALVDKLTPEQTQASTLQSRFARLKLRFNSLLDQFDIFADVISQRAEHKVGVWIAGLDELAVDALRPMFPGLYQSPAVMCFLERGHGAAIRKARTRLPGGDNNPVAIIQVPRERLVGNGIAASIIHEVGHQGVALLGLLPSIRQEMNEKKVPATQQKGWAMLQRWLSEILADFWAMSHLGIGATLGLIGVVGLPKYFMFRTKAEDPHPFPWIRVMISIAFGERLFPDPQWAALRGLWLQLYPPDPNDKAAQEASTQIQACLPAFVAMVLHHRNIQTKGRQLTEVLPAKHRQPFVLRKHFISDVNLERLSPSLAFAVIGQARADGRLSNEAESKKLSHLLTLWARRRAERSQDCALK
ncbi:MAG TPA: hypothetical protein DCF33_08560 [Saprospirales bacterium]|nr:hypothetical protein [Saprospirales bacterium]